MEESNKLLQARILAKDRHKQKYEQMLLKMEKDQGFEFAEGSISNLKTKFKLSRLQGEDPNILIMKRRVQDINTEIEEMDRRTQQVYNTGKEELINKENFITLLSNKCKKTMLDIMNNTVGEGDEPMLNKFQDIRSLDHESGVYLDVLNDEHEILEENIKKTKDINLHLRVRLDRQILTLNQLKREYLREQEKSEYRDFEIERLRKELGKDDSEYSEEDDMYDDPALLNRKRERKLKHEIE